MADYGFPFSFGAPQVQDPREQADLAQQWNAFLSDPRGRGALLSAGLTMMQPQGFGQSALGQIGQGIGVAGESVRTQEELDRKQQELERKQQEAESRAIAAESRAREAGSRTEAIGANLELKRADIERKKLLDERNYDIALQKGYRDYRMEVAKRAKMISDAALIGEKGPPPLPDLTEQQWLKANPALRPTNPDAYDRRLGATAPMGEDEGWTTLPNGVRIRER